MNESEDESDGEGYSAMRLPSLIAQLKSILDQYPDNGQILKELVQNAEDARAREVHIIYDARNCNAWLQTSAKKKNHHLKALKGPGLCVYNNEEFTKADWIGICSIQNSMKEKDRLTVGRFGLGFKSVFHLSDWPCVLSGKYILFIDPHQSTSKVCLMKKLSNLDSTAQQACLEVFSDTFGFSSNVFTEGSFQGTLFWFPLRRTSTDLSDNIYDQSKIEDLFCTFQAEAKMTLLFLKHVESIHLKRKDQLPSIQAIFSVMIASGCLKDVREKREMFLSKIKAVGSNQPEDSIQSDQHIVIETKDESLGNSSEEWIVINFYKSGHVSDTLSKLCHDTDLSYSPYVGIARPLQCDANFQGHIFCFLPLPLEARNKSGMPVHINGFFALSQNRAYMKWPTTDQERNHCHMDKSVQWNKCLVTEVLPEVYVHLIQQQIEYSQSKDNSPKEVELVYSSFPIPSMVSEIWKLILQPFYEQLWQLPVLYTGNKGGMWCCLHDSVLAVYSKSIPLKVQKTVTETYRRYDQNIVELTEELLVAVNIYSSQSAQYVGCQTLCNLLRSSNIYKTFSREDRLNLLKFILEFDVNCLHGLELLPVADGSFVMFSTKVVFCPGKAQLFPGLERKLIADDIDHDVHVKLGHMAKNGQHKLTELTQAIFHDLIKECLDLNMPRGRKVQQYSSNVVGRKWLENIWLFVHERYVDVQSVFKMLPVLPEFQVPDCAILHQLTEVFIGQKLHQMDPLPGELAKALETMGIIVLPEVPTFIFSAVDQGLIHEPSCSGVLRALTQICNKGRAEKAIDSFNKFASVTQKRSVIQYLQYSGYIPDPAKKLLKSLNLFDRTGSKTVSQKNVLDTSINVICHIAPKTNLPVQYPDVYLDCSEPMARHLAKFLDAVELTLVDVVLQILDTVGNTCQTQYNTDEVQSFMLFLLQNSTFLSNKQIKEKAKTVKFLSPLNGSILRAAAEVFDPRLELLKTLFVKEDRFPNGRFQDSRVLDEMYNLGLKQIAHVTSEDICHSVKTVEQMLNSGSKREAVTKGYAVLKFLENHLNVLSVERLKPISSVQWFPVLLSRPTSYPSRLPLYGECTDRVLGRPNEMTRIEHLPLVGSTCVVAAKNVSSKIADLFDWNKSPSLNKVVDHLINTVEANSEDQHDKIITIMNESFKYLSNIGSLPQSVQEKLTDTRLVWIESENGFQKPNVLWINTSKDDIDLCPFRFCLPKHLGSVSEMFVKLGSASHQTPDMLLNVLVEIKNKHDGTSVGQIDINKDLALVLQILNIIKTMKNLERDRILVPVHMTNRQLKLMTVKKCTYCNAQWLKESSLCEDEHTGDDAIWYVHEDVSEATAIELGVCSLTNRVMEDTEEFDTNYGQKEPLTSRLNNLLKDYKDGFSVPKEIIQNADDAGASEVMFLYDERDNMGARSFLIKETMDSLQGPALWAFNDAKFQDSDFENITKLSGATKEDDTRKIGKFGLGFNSIYNLTDVPSFISGNTVVIFDPHTSYLGKPGIKANLSSHKNQVMIKKMKGQFQPFEGVFGCHLENKCENDDCCPGTLFRFPLRTQQQASESKIKNLHYSRDEMGTFLKVFLSGAGNLLLFLQSVKRVKLYHLPKDSEDATKPHLIMEVRRSDIKKSVEMNESILSYMSRKCHQQCNTSSSENDSITEKIDIKISVSQKAEELFDIKPSSSETNWCIAWVTGQKESAVFAKSNKIRGMLPLAAAAVLYQKEQGNARLISLKDCPAGFYNEGHLFCFLPLPVSFPLPMHVNGIFALTHDRRQLCVKTEDDKTSPEAEWNEALMSDAVCLAIVKVIEELQQMDVQQSETSYSLWPKNMDKHITLQKSFYKLALTTEHKIFTQNGKWASFKNSVFLDPSVRFDKNIGGAAFKALVAFQNEGLVVDLPEEIIKGLSSESSELFKSKIMTTSAFFEMIIFSNINDSYWENNDRDEFIMYALLQNSDQINKLIKEVPCIPTKPSGTLKRPQDLIHPEGKASRLFCETDERFPSGKLNLGFCKYQALKALESFGMVMDNLNWNDIFERIQTIQIMSGTDSKKATERCRNVLNYLCNETENPMKENRWKPKKRYETCPEDIKQKITSENFLPILKKPSGWLFPWKADHSESILAKPEELFFKNTECLVGSVELVLDETILDMFSNKGMLAWLGIREKKQVPISSVIHHLLELSTSSLDYKKLTQYTVQNVSQCIYAFLNEVCIQNPEEQNSESEAISNQILIAQELRDKKVLWHNGKFVCAKQLVMELECNLEPYLDKVDEMLRASKDFLIILGIRQSVSITDLRIIFDDISQKYEVDAVTGSDLLCIINAAKLMVDLKKKNQSESSDGDEQGTLLIKLPDKKGYLHPVSELCMDDYEMIEDNSLNILHPDILPSVAKMLGVKTKRSTHLQVYEDPDFCPFGQHEDLTRRIKRILSGYPLDSAIMKELLQNADDAKATEIMFIKDFRTHPSDRIFGESWSELQGPALCVYNDSYFTNDDFSGIQNLGLGSKSEDPVKIGQYGVGFNSVYHLTDVPSFLTVGPDIKETLCILDPNMQYIQIANTLKPGARLTVKESLKTEYQDVFDGFPTSQVNMQNRGTMFRLPLRTSIMAEESSISNDEVTTECVDSLLDDFKKDMFKSLLFLHNVKKISIASIAGDGTMEIEYMVQTEMSSKDKTKQAGFLEHLETQAENVADSGSGIGVNDMSPYEIQLQLNITDNQNRKEKWLVVHRAGFATDHPVPEFLSTAWAKGDIHQLPQGGIAVNLESESLPSVKDAFCMLPLPIHTGLPVHINGHFALDHEARRNLWSGNNDYRTVWNKHIVTALLVPAYCTALHAMKAKQFAYCGGTNDLSEEGAERVVQKYNSLFPDMKACHNELWKSLVVAFYQEIVNKRLSLFITKVVNKKSKTKDLVVRLESIPATVISGFPGYFNNLSYSGNNHMKKILKDLGLRLIEASERIYENFDVAGLQDQICFTTPDKVVKFLKSYTFQELPGRCCIGSLPDKVEKTALKNRESAKCLIEFCQKANNFWDELEGIPLLLLESGDLYAFTLENPVIVTKYTDLLHGSKNKLMMQSVVDLFKEKVNDIPQLRQLDIQQFEELLPETLETSLFHSGQPVLWEENPDYPSKEWIHKLWIFLSEQVERPTQEQTNGLIPEQLEQTASEPSDDTIPKHLGSMLLEHSESTIQEQAGSLTSQESESAPLDHSENKTPNLALVTQLLSNWSLLPVTWNSEVTETNESHSDVKNYLFPIKDVMKVLHCVDMKNDMLNKALESIVTVPKLDCTMFDPTNKAFQLASSLVTNPSDLRQLLDILVSCKYEETFCKTFATTLLKYFSDNVAKLQDVSDTDMCKNMRKLPFFETLNNSWKPLEGCGTVVFLTNYCSVPKEGIDAWCSESNITVFKEDEQVSKVYDFLKVKPIHAVHLYTSLFLPNFGLFPSKAKIHHLKYIKYTLLSKSLDFNDDQKALIAVLKDVPFIEIEDGTLHKASQFYSKLEPVFKAMCKRSDFPPHPFDDSRWHDFLVLAGMISEVTSDLFVMFANEVANKAFTETTEKVAELSQKLLKHITCLSEDDFISLFSKIKNIRFVVPLDLSKCDYGNEMLKICPQFVYETRLVAFEGSVSNKFVYQVWSSHPMLCDEASSIQKRFKNLCYETPPKESVIKHMQNVCSYMQEGGTSHLQDQNMKKLVGRVMSSLYQYLSKTCLSDSDITQLSTFATIHFPKDDVFRKAENIVTDLESHEVIDGFLYKAPTIYGHFFDVFHKLGASKIVTANHYALILKKLFDVTKGGTLNPSQLKTVKKVVKELFICLGKKEKNDLYIECLYLPNTHNALSISSARVMSDNTFLRERCTSLNIMFMLDFRKMGCNIHDPVKAIKSLSQKYQPKLLTEIAEEKISSEKEKFPSARYMNIVKCDSFITGLIRLISHARKQKDANLSEHDAKNIEEKLSSLEVFEVRGLKTALFYQNEMIRGSEESVPCFTEIKNAETEKRICVYLNTAASDNESTDENVDELAYAVNSVTGNQLGPLVLCVRKMILCKAGEISQFLDRQRIKEYTYEISEKTSLWPQPAGTHIPKCFHWMLENTFNFLDKGECIGMEVYDALSDGDPADDCDNVSQFVMTRYCCAIVKRKDGRSPIFCSYIVHVGHGKEELIPATKLFKIHHPIQSATSIQSIENVDDSLERIMENIRKTLKECCRHLDVAHRRKVRNRLYMRWHPDKNPGREHDCQKICKFIALCVEKLDAGESIDNITEDELASEASQHCRWSEGLNQRALDHKHDRQNAIQKGSSYFNSTFDSGDCDLQEAGRWMRQAQMDHTTAQNCGTFNWICFKCYQAAKEAVTALHYGTVGTPRNIHSIHDLEVFALRVHEPGLIPLIRELKIIIKDYVKLLYPDDLAFPNIASETYTEVDAQQACEVTGRIISYVKQKLH